jgi:hypothetical protein
MDASLQGLTCHMEMYIHILGIRVSLLIAAGFGTMAGLSARLDDGTLLQCMQFGRVCFQWRERARFVSDNDCRLVRAPCIDVNGTSYLIFRWIHVFGYKQRLCNVMEERNRLALDLCECAL